MNACDEPKTEWHILMGNLKQEWAELTYDDLQNLEGRHDVLIRRIQKRTGTPLDAIEAAVRNYRGVLADANRRRQLRNLSKLRS